MSKLQKLLHNKATNRSKSDSLGNTPRIDKQKINQISTIKMSYNLQYNTVAIECFYLNSKRSYKLDLPKNNVELLNSIVFKEITEPKSILDIDVDDDWEV